MAKSRFIIFFWVGFVVLLMEQAVAEQGTNTPRVERRVEMLKERLSLTDSQAEKVRSILEDEQQRALADRDRYSENSRAAERARLQRRKDTDRKILAVLDAQQRKTYDRIKDEFRQGPTDGKVTRRSDDDRRRDGQSEYDRENLQMHLNMLRNRLNLSDSQSDRIRYILNDAQKKMRENWERNQDNPVAFEKFRSDRIRITDEKIMRVLDTRQKKQYDRIKDDIRRDLQDEKSHRKYDRRGADQNRQMHG